MNVWTEVKRRRDGRYRWNVWLDSTRVRTGVARSRFTATVSAGWWRRRQEAIVLGGSDR